MKRVLSFLLLSLIVAGCASSDRMFRMSGGVLDEYSAPKSSRIRSEKYQKMSREFASSSRSNKTEVAGLNDTLINIWPFFFRSNDYWSILWPMIDKDPYGFAFRPFYNHEGDDYSILFPLTAWNRTAGHGWVTLFGWNKTGFGIVPLTWQWKERYSGGFYYTPLLIYSYDQTPLTFSTNPRWFRTDSDLFAMLFYRTHKTRVEPGDKRWLFSLRHDSDRDKREWNYRFNGQKPFPATGRELDKYCKEVFDQLPREVRKSYGIFPLWHREVSTNGDYQNRILLLAGNKKSGKNTGFDIAGSLIFAREKRFYNNWSLAKSFQKTSSLILLSRFFEEEKYQSSARYQSYGKLRNLCWQGEFNQQKPAIVDELKKFDPVLTLPDSVTDHNTYSIFLDELWQKYEFPTEKSYTGGVLPFYLYRFTPTESNWGVPALLTWKLRDKKSSFFGSIPLLTFVSRSPQQHITTVMTPLVYWEKELFRNRSEHPVFPQNEQRVSEWSCVQLRDLYMAGGLFYRGRFAFNAANDGVDAGTVESLRKFLTSLPIVRRTLDQRQRSIREAASLNDRWQTVGKIEQLKKLIRYEELKIRRQELVKDELKYIGNVKKALQLAEKLNFPLNKEVFADREKAADARSELVEKYTGLRFYEDIGNGLFFRKEKNYNGDYNWHFCHILAGGEKRGERESTHILHLLYRYRKEGQRSETICFPFISAVRDGENSRVSFLWRLFSLSKENGRTGGYIFFIPFGSKW